MKKISILMCTVFISIGCYSNIHSNEWENFIGRFDKEKNGNANEYSVGQCNVNENDLDDMDNFINDYMEENQPKTQQIPHNNIIGNNNNQNRRLSCDVANNKYHALQNYQNNAKPVIRPSTAERCSNEVNNNYQTLPNNNIQQKNIIIDNDQLGNNRQRKYTTDDSKKTNNLKKILTGISGQPTNARCVPSNNQLQNQAVPNNNEVNVNPNQVIPTQHVQNHKNQVPEIKLTDEEFAQIMSNKAPNINTSPTVNNNRAQTVNNPIEFPSDNRNRNNMQNNIQVLTGRNNRLVQRVQVAVNYNIINDQTVGHVNINEMPQQRVQLNQNNAIIRIVQNNIPTYWEKGITQNEINLFLNNIKNNNAFENTKMQIYSLLGNIAPGFGNPDHIRLLLDVIKYNKHNGNQKHVYRYEKPLALAGTFIDYYINNIDLYNTNREQFKLGGIEYSKRELNYDNQDYSISLNYINTCQYYYVVPKIVKGINLIECFKNTRNQNQLELNQIPLSDDINKDWLNSTFQLFDYAVQYASNPQDRIKNTQFARFTKYLQTHSQHRDINEKIKLIPTLKDFVAENKEQFSNYKINSALEALYKEAENNGVCCGIMGSITLYRIFPELQTIFSSNQFGIHDGIIDIATKFYFTTDQSLFTQFNEQAQQVLELARYDNGRRLFRNTDYLMMVTNGLTRQQVINNRQYISRYHEKIANNIPENLELYELIGVQFCSPNNVNYITVSGEKLNDAVDSNSTFGKLCISNNLQPMQALYKFVSQEDYNKSIKKA